MTFRVLELFLTSVFRNEKCLFPLPGDCDYIHVKLPAVACIVVKLYPKIYDLHKQDLVFMPTWPGMDIAPPPHIAFLAIVPLILQSSGLDKYLCPEELVTQ